MQGIELEKITREIAELDEKLKGYQQLLQRRADLLQFKMLADRLYGSRNGNGYKTEPVLVPESETEPKRQTIAGLAAVILKTSGPMNTTGLLKAMREAGWTGSGDDAKDRKNIYAGIYRKDEFRLDRGVWSLSQ